MSNATNEKKKVSDPSLQDCANCGTTGPKLTCAKCKITQYCSKACQKQHWKNGHKEMCFTPEERRPRILDSGAEFIDEKLAGTAGAGGNTGECPICLEAFSGGSLCTLPCKHEFHGDCVEAIRKQGARQACPTCMFVRVDARHRAAGGSWKPLTAFEVEKMIQIVDMWVNSANQGHLRATCNLACIYLNGSGVAQDHNEAAQWYRKAADQGVVNAQLFLGHMYSDGKGVAQNLNEAVQWYSKAADQGLANAQCILGDIHSDGEGVVQNFKEAVRWYRKAADQGFADAQFNLGTMYQYGKGVTKDLNEAVRWYRKAADQGLVTAQVNLGSLYRAGEGVAQDLNKARRWYLKAIDQGSAEAQSMLGNMYYNGQGVAQDDDKAARLFRKASHNGFAQAQFSLGVMYCVGSSVAQDYNEAAHWFRKAADQGHAESQLRLGAMYYEGKGVAQNMELADSLILAAEAQGNEKAQELRKRIDLTKLSGIDTQNVHPPNQCTCCGRIAEDGAKLKPCPRCKGPSYCGKDCQRTHWEGGHNKCCTQK